MTSRRSFFRSIAVGTTACLVGCDGTAPPAPMDAGVGCDLPRPPAPPELDYPPAAYFEQVATDLTAAGVGTPTIFIDMDRADANIDAIAGAIRPASRFRIVVKSLPSLDLLAHVSERSGSESFLVLHLPLLADLLATRPSADVLIGKTHRPAAVQRFFDALPSDAERLEAASRVTFLVDEEQSLAALGALGAQLGTPLRVAVEIDVGLRRSGLTEPAQLRSMLGTFAGSTDLELAGLLGYDGHIAFHPAGTPEALGEAWMEATQIYQSFVDVLREPAFAALVSDELIFHSGGTSSYPMYGSGTPVNDVAAGGGVVRPSAYPNHVLGDLSPAMFIAAPVLRRYEAPQLPFFTAEQTSAVLDGAHAVTIHGGSWPTRWSHPPDVRPAPLVNDPEDHVFVPNQSVLTVPASTALSPGDWVFFHPRQADAMFQFEQIRRVRAGRLEDTAMAPYPRRY